MKWMAVSFTAIVSMGFVSCGDDDHDEEASGNQEASVASVTTCPDANHPHVIDLGLPSGTKWACCNVGASAPEQYGNYYAWGETKPKDVYGFQSYQYGSSKDNLVDIGLDIAGTSYDAATANWGAPWRMPSLDQIVELCENCSYTWTTQNGVEGGKFTGSNGGTVFIPAAGYRGDSGLHEASTIGMYWSSINGSGLGGDPYYGMHLGVYSGRAHADDKGRPNGLSVRPVR